MDNNQKTSNYIWVFNGPLTCEPGKEVAFGSESMKLDFPGDYKLTVTFVFDAQDVRLRWEEVFVFRDLPVFTLPHTMAYNNGEDEGRTIWRVTATHHAFAPAVWKVPVKVNKRCRLLHASFMLKCL